MQTGIRIDCACLHAILLDGKSLAPDNEAWAVSGDDRVDSSRLRWEIQMRTLTGKKRRKATTEAPAAARRAGSGPKSEDVVELRRRLGLNQTDFARLLSVSVRSLATIESGAPARGAVARRLVELSRLIEGLTEVVRVESLGVWLQTANDALDGFKPIEVIERGEADRLWAMIYFLRSGVPA
jgi:DNA-binding transcriptional regulator YiaG